MAGIVERNEVGCRAARAGLRAVVAGVAILGAALPAQAQYYGGPAPSRGHVELRLGTMHFDYEETDADGTFLDGEKGFIPAIALEGELRGDQAFGRLTLRLARGGVDYTGHVQSANADFNGLPISANSDAQFLQGEVQGGFLLGPARQVALFAALGARKWSRDIRDTTVTSRSGVPGSVSGISEEYSWYELQLGVRWEFLQLPGTTWDAEARLVRTAGASIMVDLTPFGGSKVDMDLGARTGWRLGSTFRHDFNPGLFLSASTYVEGYAFGKSSVNQTYMILEPDSTTTNFGLELGLGTRF